MRARVGRHRKERPAGWLTIEEPLAIADTIKLRGPGMDFILLDCLTIWLSNFCSSHRDCPTQELEQSASQQIACLIAASPCSHLVAVTNEVGCGIVPESPISRNFRDIHGFINQQVAGAADYVYQTVAGIPVLIKPRGGCA